MTAPLGADLDLQIAMAAALTASADIQSLIGNPPRISQDVPDKPVFPYLTIGFGTATDQSVQGMDASEGFPVVHVWSRAALRESKQIEAAVRAALHNIDLTLSENRCFSILFERSDFVPENDATTKHIAITFHAQLEPAA